jgi:sugar (pentulose or hexulose) kinase
METKMPDTQILAIDNGTQSVRALIFDLKGQLIAKKQVPIQPYFSRKQGWAEQDPNVFWDGICQACQGLWGMPGVNKNALVGVGLTTQRSTVINLDENMTPLRPAIVWLDQRRTKGLKPVGGLWGFLFKLSGMEKTVKYLQAEAEANWIKTQQPEIWAKTNKFVFLSGFLTYKLVGKVLDSTGCQVGYVPFDYKNQDWAKPSDWRWEAVMIEREKLPELVKPTELLGMITPEASQATGIPEGLPLIATAADKATEVIGAGCVDPHIGCLSYGTTATINTTHKKYTEVIPLIPPYPAAVPGAYSLEIQIYRGYWMVSWFKEQFGQMEVEKAEALGVEPEDLFEDLLQAAPAGSDGLVLQPYWSPGLRVPGPEARGAVIGFNDHHTRAHLYRAIIEGLAYGLREGAERTEKRSHIPITALRVAGGGSQSPTAMKITADIFGLPVSRPHVYEASGLGAAIDVAVGLNLHPDFETAVDHMTHLGDTFEPNWENHKIYSEIFEKIYKKMYSHLQPLYNDINDIVN